MGAPRTADNERIVVAEVEGAAFVRAGEDRKGHGPALFHAIGSGWLRLAWRPGLRGLVGEQAADFYKPALDRADVAAKLVGDFLVRVALHLADGDLAVNAVPQAGQEVADFIHDQHGEFGTQIVRRGATNGAAPLL